MNIYDFAQTTEYDVTVIVYYYFYYYLSAAVDACGSKKSEFSKIRVH